MTNKLEIHGLDLTGMGIGDVRDEMVGSATINLNELFSEHLFRQILGSITFGPVHDIDIVDIELTDDDEDWPLAE